MRQKLSRLLTDLIELAERDLRAFPVQSAHREWAAVLSGEIAAIDGIPSESGIRHTRFALLMLHVIQMLHASPPGPEEEGRMLRSFGLALIPMVQFDAHAAMLAERAMVPAERQRA